MLILGIDTCTETIDVAVVRDGKTVARRRGSAPKQQLTKLIPFVSEVLGEAKCAISEINLIAVTSGPGSFTGIRLGLATAKTLAQVNGIPVASVDTLEALALGCEMDGIIIPSIDARKDEIFFAVFQKNGFELEEIRPFEKLHVDEYVKFLEGLEYDDPVITGSVLWRYGNRVREALRIKHRVADEEFWTPRGDSTAVAGGKIFGEGKSTDYLHLSARYMRQWEATPPKPLI